MSEVNKTLPTHVAVIMDGNGRWAKTRHLPRIAGHKAGVESVRMIVRECVEQQIKVITLFAFSSENWARPKAEVSGLMRLFITALKREVTELHKNQIQLRFIGDFTRLSDTLKKAMDAAVQLTANNKRLILVIAIDYGGRWDILQATKQIVQKVQQNEYSLEQVDEQIFEQALSTHDLPAPDLLIRTSGEQRISNFLLWQFAYTELFFTDVYWPDFKQQNFLQALKFYANRERKFGQVSANET